MGSWIRSPLQLPVDVVVEFFPQNFHEEVDEGQWVIDVTYTVSHRECGQFRPYVHENFKKFKMISTDGQLDSIVPEAKSTARRGRNHFEYFKVS